MDQGSIAAAVKQICDEKGISFDTVIEIIEAALAAAYRKDFGEKNQNIKVDFNIETGGIKVFDVKTVVEDQPEEVLAEIEAQQLAEDQSKEQDRRAPRPEMPREEKEVVEGEEEHRYNPKTDLQISEAKKIKPDAELGEIITTELEAPTDFGRMAAQTAKQVITQKVRETERETLFNEFKDKQGEILAGTIQRAEGRLVLVDLGRITALLPPEEQIRGEHYTAGAHVKVYVVSVNMTTKGPEIIVSRAHKEIVRQLFMLEIPEIANGTVEIKGIAREAGSRSKVAVYTADENIDPIGSCIGQRGARIQTIISELRGEKVDIIKYSESVEEYIGNALSPAKIDSIVVKDEEKNATVTVAEDQLSLAIGKAGQNVRLAAKLTGWKIDIISHEGEKVADDQEIVKPEAVGEEVLGEADAVVEEAVEEKPKKKAKNKGEGEEAQTNS